VNKIEIPKVAFEKTGALKKVHRILICAVTFLLLTVGFYFLIYSPKSEEIVRLEGELSKIQGELTQAKIQAKNLPKLEKELKDAKIELKKALRLLPDKKELPQLLDGITSAGKLAGLEFLLFQPGKEVNKGFYAEIPVVIKVNGLYHDVAVFFDKVSKLPRIVNISDVKIRSENRDDSNILTTSCIAKTYRFIEGADVASKKTNK
jgi:type IV pilus assembly protein PilO